MVPAININEVSLKNHFAPSQVKHMLPIYLPCTVDNLFCIFKYFISHNYPKALIPIPDQNLTFQEAEKSPLYEQKLILWENNFDDQSQHLKNTLHFGSSLINFIYEYDKSIIQVEEQKNVPQHDYVKRVDIMECKQGTVFRNKSQYTTILGNKRILGYNFMAKNDRIYAIFGFSNAQRDNPVICSHILRKWNLERLKINQIGSQIQVQHLHRIVQHLFSICRGFIREVNDDYNTFKTNLRNMMNQIQNSQFHQAQILNSLKQSKIENTNPAFVTNIITYHITFRQQLAQRDLWNIVKESVVQWLLKSPINVSCSYASSLVYQQGTHNLILTLSTSYKEDNSHKQENASINNSHFNKVTHNIQTLMLDNIENKEKQNSDSFKSSMDMLNKYQQRTVEKDFMNQSQISQKSKNSYNGDQFINKNNRSMNASMISQSPTKISIKKIAKIQNEIYQILKILESNQKILNPIEIQKGVRTFVNNLQKQYKHSLGYGIQKEQQYDAMRALQAINEEIGAQDIYLLLINHPNETGIILDGFLHNSRYDNAIILGKIMAKDHLESLYSKSLQFGLSQHRHSLIPFFLKKMVLKYGKTCKWHSLQADKVSVPNLVQVIQQKKYDSRHYAQILTIILPQLFKDYQQVIKPIAPLVCLYLQFLMRQDHHFQIVYSFIGDLMYQVCYFPHQLKFNTLSNSMYFQDKYIKSISIKQKRIICMIREGGFRGFGYQIKNNLINNVQQYRNYRYAQPFVYNIYSMMKKSDLCKLFRIISSSHYTQDIIKVGKYLERRNNYAEYLKSDTPIIAFFLIKEHHEMSYFQQNQQNDNQLQYNSLTQRILKSESGIFEDMVRLNPKVKIAGIELNTVMKSLSDSRSSMSNMQKKHKKGCVDVQQAVRTIITEQLERNYQFVELAMFLKQKYVQYHTLNESEKQYFRDCADSAIENKEKIVKYAMMSSKVKKHMEKRQIK